MEVAESVAPCDLGRKHVSEGTSLRDGCSQSKGKDCLSASASAYTPAKSGPERRGILIFIRGSFRAREASRVEAATPLRREA